HVNGCAECQERYRRLAQKLRETAACPAEKPATFWTRQRMLITRAVEDARRPSSAAVRGGRIAAAAMLAFILGGAVVYKTVQPKTPAVVVAQQTATTQSEDMDLQVPRDPWQDDELKDFGTVVAWETCNGVCAGSLSLLRAF